MKIFKYGTCAIVLNHVEVITKGIKSHEYFKDNKDRFILCFELVSGKEQEIYYKDKEERDRDYKEIISIIEGIE